MYPAVMKNNRYPLGMPLVFGRADLGRFGLPPPPWKGTDCGNGLLEIRGFFLVRILPPDRMPELSGNAQELLPPFLPYRTSAGLLVFPLCAKCSERQQRLKCKHTDKQRSWVDAIMDEDLALALQLNYTILDVFEVFLIISNFLNLCKNNRYGIGHQNSGQMEAHDAIYFVDTSIPC